MSLPQGKAEPTVVVRLRVDLLAAPSLSRALMALITHPRAVMMIHRTFTQPRSFFLNLAFEKKNPKNLFLKIVNQKNVIHVLKREKTDSQPPKLIGRAPNSPLSKIITSIIQLQKNSVRLQNTPSESDIGHSVQVC